MGGEALMFGAAVEVVEGAPVAAVVVVSAGESLLQAPATIVAAINSTRMSFGARGGECLSVTHGCCCSFTMHSVRRVPRNDVDKVAPCT